MNMEYNEGNIKKIGYSVMCAILMEIIYSGKRIAYAKELKSIKMLVDQDEVDLEADMALLAILEEPQVKFAYELADFTINEVINPYALVNSLEDDSELEDEWADDMGKQFFWKFMFYRKHPRVRERYMNFNRVLLTAQRVVFELIKFMVSGETKAFERTYRSNYSAGRFKAWTIGNKDRNVLLLARLIRMLKDYEEKSRAMTTISTKRQQL